MIHSENPFAPSEDDLAKRFRGRLAAPVTIVTSGDETGQTGLTVSSLLLLEGAPPTIHAAVTPNSDLFDVAGRTGRFVVHICRSEDSGLADVFAGIRPSPGGLFVGTDIDHTPWGPVMTHLTNRVFCTTKSISESGWSGLLVGNIDRAEVSDLSDPLIHFRGRYRHLG